MRAASSAALAILLLLLAGCATLPNLNANDVRLDAPSTGGTGKATWNIRVSDPWGKPLADTPVVAYWPAKTWECDDGDKCVELHYVKLRTDEAGLAKARTPSAAKLSVVAQREGYTEEWAMGRPPQRGRDIDIHLLPPSARLVINGTWDTVAFEHPRCRLQTYTFGGDVGPKHWAAKTTALNVTLTWSNDVGSAADLDITYDVVYDGGSSCPDRDPPSPDALMPGARQANRTITAEEVDLGKGWDEVRVGPVARGVPVGVSLDYQMVWDAEFSLVRRAGYEDFLGFDDFEYNAVRAIDVTHPAKGEAKESPAAAAGLAMAALAALAWGRRNRGA